MAKPDLYKMYFHPTYRVLRQIGKYCRVCAVDHHQIGFK